MLSPTVKPNVKTLLYHGTNSNFDKFSKEMARMVNDFYGGGVAYLTDNKDVAITYAKSMVKTKGKGSPTIMYVDCVFKKVFDVDYTFSGKELTQFLPNNLEDFARGAKLLKFGVDKFSVLSKLKNGTLSLSGKDVFFGLSGGMQQTAKARDILIKHNYDALRYNGGENMGMATRHNVYIAFTNNGLDIIKKEIFVKSKSEKLH